MVWGPEDEEGAQAPPQPGELVWAQTGFHPARGHLTPHRKCPKLGEWPPLQPQRP